MDLYLAGIATGIYAAFVTLGLARGTIRLCHQILQDLAKLTAVAVVTSLLCCQAVAVVLVVVAGYCLYNNLPTPHLIPKGKAVFITGCDTGLGHLLARHLDSLGMDVIAGCLFPEGEGEKELKSACSDRLTTVRLDVGKVDSVKAAAEVVRRQLEGKELWGVVNNAGILLHAPLEVISEEDFQRVININFMGQVHVIRAFLPMIRKSKGRIVNIASNMGIAPSLFGAAYCSSKAAVATLTECLCLELRHFNVHCSTIIPSGFRTGILQQFDTLQAVGDRWWAMADKDVQESYGQSAFYPEYKVKDFKAMTNPDFSGIIHKMADALLEKTPKDFYYKGLLARSLPFLYLHTPSSIARLFMDSFVEFYKFKPQTATGQNANGNKQD